MEIRGGEGMEAEGSRFAEKLEPSSGAVVVSLEGDLGSGKTTFVRGAARQLGIEESITSPTFVIEKRYAPSKGPFTAFIHIDAYRLEKERELEVLGFRDLLRNSGNVIFIEWAERVPAVMPNGAKSIRFRFIDDTKREVEYVE